MREHQDNNDEFGMGIVFTGRIPLEWHTSSDKLSAKALSDNEKCLRIILALSEYPTEPSEELAALERKVDITLEMVAELLRSNLDISEPVDIHLGAHELAWRSPLNLPAVGEAIELAIYLHDLYPRPLRLKGKVKASNGESCHVSLEEQSEEVQQLLEKYIFLHHRRQIHQQRHSLS